jgi:hypothetical protein
MNNGGQTNTHQDRDQQEHQGLRRQHGHRGDRHAAGLGDAGHDSQDDEAQDVIHDGRPEDHLYGGIMKTTKVSEHTRRDADAGGGEGGSDEHSHKGVVSEPVHDAVSNCEWDGDADQCHERGLRTRPQQVMDVGLQADFEQKNQDTELGQGVKNLRLMDKAHHARADDHAGQQFTQDGGLADPLHALARHLGGKPDKGEAEQQVAKLHLLGRYLSVTESPSATRIGLSPHRPTGSS